MTHAHIGHHPTHSQESGVFMTSSAWSLNAIFGQVSLSSAYFLLTPRNIQIKRISLAKNILRALNANDIPPLIEYPRSHQVCTHPVLIKNKAIYYWIKVTFRYYVGMLNFLNEEYAEVVSLIAKHLTSTDYSCTVRREANSCLLSLSYRSP